MQLKTSAQYTLIGVPVLAHAGHFENKEQTETKNTDSSSNQAESNPSSKQSQTDHQSSSHDHQEEATSTSKTNNQTTNQAVEEQSTTQAQIVTINQIPTLGETILGLIVATPFFLYALRKRIHQ